MEDDFPNLVLKARKYNRKWLYPKLIKAGHTWIEETIRMAEGPRPGYCVAAYDVTEQEMLKRTPENIKERACSRCARRLYRFYGPASNSGRFACYRENSQFKSIEDNDES